MGVTPRPPARDQDHTLGVEWTTISYRAIALYAGLALLVLGTVLYLVAPNYFGRKIKGALSSLSAGVGGGKPAGSATAQRDAHFVNLDGNVRIKQARSLQWVRADYNSNLQKGDFVQTGSDGVARIIFADGTNYMLKPDSLIVVEESKEDPVTRATRVSVQVTSGAVDLSTGKFEVPGSTSQVSFSDAVASLAEESRAMVRNDPSKNRHELTVDQGQAEVRRGSNNIRLGQYDQVTFDSAKPGLVQNKVTAPPVLSEPENMALTVSKDPKAEPLDFGWTEVPGAVAYHLQVSPSTMLSNFVVDKKVSGKTSFRVSGLDEGTYYWVVSSIDAKGIESQPSSANRFNLVQQAEAGTEAFLEITRIVQHGKVVEVVGRTEPGSSVIINNEQVFSMAPDGTFRHFTSPLPRSGSNQITITAQNRKGDTKTIRKPIVIE
jgi:hypothetical protein